MSRHIHPLWSGLGKHRSRPDLTDDGRMVRDALARHAPDILAGRPGAVLTRETLDVIRSELAQKQPGPRIGSRFKLLARGLTAGAAGQGWRIPDVGHQTTIRLERPAVTVTTMADLGPLRAAETRFVAHLALPDGREAQLGQLLISAVLWGAWVDPVWLGPWISALPGGLRHGGALWLEVDRVTKTGDRETRRWFADPMTALLIRRWLLNGADGQADAVPAAAGPDSFYKAFLRVLEPDDAQWWRRHFPKIRDLTLAAGSGLAVRLPGFLVAQACGTARRGGACTALPATVWSRMVRGGPVLVPEQDALPTEDLEPLSGEPVLESAAGGHISAQQAILFRIKQRLRLNSTVPAARLVLKSGLDGTVPLTPIVTLLLRWALHRLQNTNPAIGGTKLQPSSVIRYFDHLDGPLIEAFGSDDPVDLDGDALAERYRDIVLSRRSSAEQAAALGRLKDIHSWIRQHMRAVVVDFADVGDGIRSVSGRVDANLVTALEMNTARQLLCPDPRHGLRLQRIRWLALTLAWRTGLRRGEVRRLRLKDVSGSSDTMVLLIRSSRYGRVKSDDGRRLLPLEPLMTAEECQVLEYWRAARREEADNDGEALLFTRIGADRDPIPDSLLFDPITRALHQVTRDPQITFHHLRHSFVTLLLLRLFLPLLPDDTALPAGLADPDFPNQRCRALRDRLLGPMQSRAILHVVSALAGHAAPATTLRHYVHAADILTSLLRDRPALQPVFDFDTAASLVSFSRSGLYALRQKAVDGWQPGALWAVVSRTGPPPPDHGLEAAVEPDLSPITVAQDAALARQHWSWRSVYAAVAWTRTGSSATVAGRLDLPPDILQLWLERATAIDALRTRTGGKRFRPDPDLPGAPVVLATMPDGQSAALVERMVKHARRLAGNELDIVDGAIQIFLLRYSPSIRDVRLHSMDEAAQYRRALTLLGIDARAITLLHYPHPDATPVEAAHHQTSWCNWMDVPDNACQSRGRSNPSRLHPSGIIGVRVHALDVEGKRSPQACRGFMLGILTLAVLEGYGLNECPPA